MNEDQHKMHLPLTMNVETGVTRDVVSTVEDLGPTQNMLSRNHSPAGNTIGAPPPPPPPVRQQGPHAVMTNAQQALAIEETPQASFDGSEKENMYNNYLTSQPPNQPSYPHQTAEGQQSYNHEANQMYLQNEYDVRPENRPQYLPNQNLRIYPAANKPNVSSSPRKLNKEKGSASLGRRRRTLSMDDQGVLLDLHPVFYSAGLTAFSLLLLVQSVVDCSATDPGECHKGNFMLAIIVCSLTIVMTFIIPLIWLFFIDSEKSVKKTADTLCPWLSIVIAALWLITTPLITYNHPYKNSGNGYFFAWAMFCIALYFARDVNEEFKNYMGFMAQVLMGNRFDRTVARSLILCSLFFVVSAMVNFIGNGKNTEDNTSESWFVMITGIICFLLLMVYEVVIAVLGLYQEEVLTDEENPSASLDDVEPPMEIISIILAVMWFTIAILSTFSESSPFKMIGNGYFASWGCAFGSLLLLLAVFGLVDKEGVL
jgi:hypothetical protein